MSALAPFAAMAEPMTEVELAALIDTPGDTLPWQIDGTGSAEWAMAKLAQYEAKGAEIDEQAKEWAKRVEEWRTAERRRHRIEQSVAFFRGHLERYALALRAEDPAAKTLHLPSGEVRTRMGSPAIVIDDEVAFYGWALEHKLDLLTLRPCMAEIRRYTEIVERPTAAAVTFSPCGCIATYADGRIIPGVGDGMDCPACGSYALAARVEVAEAAHDVVLDGEPVPGVVARAGEVSASVSVGSAEPF